MIISNRNELNKKKNKVTNGYYFNHVIRNAVRILFFAAAKNALWYKRSEHMVDIININMTKCNSFISRTNLSMWHFVDKLSIVFCPELIR